MTPTSFPPHQWDCLPPILYCSYFFLSTSNFFTTNILQESRENSFYHSPLKPSFRGLEYKVISVNNEHCLFLKLISHRISLLDLAAVTPWGSERTTVLDTLWQKDSFKYFLYAQETSGLVEETDYSLLIDT